MSRLTEESIKRVLTFLNKGLISHEDWAAYLKDGKEEPAYVGNLATHEWYIGEYRYAQELVNGIERLLAQERERFVFERVPTIEEAIKEICKTLRPLDENREVQSPYLRARLKQLIGVAVRDERERLQDEIQSYQSDPRYDNRYLQGQEDMRKPMGCGHFRACLSPITVEYRDGTVVDTHECSFCVQLKAEQDRGAGFIVDLTKKYDALLVAEREKVRDVIRAANAAEHWRKIQREPTLRADEWQAVLVKIRQLDLTAPSTEEGGEGK
jgi:hypothetical protein